MSSNTSINDEMFEYIGNGQRVPKGVVNVRFHPTVVEIDNGAFFHCKSLKELVLNEGLRNIGDRSFAYCSLESITLPSTVTSIYRDAFESCEGLKKVVLNEGLVKLGNRAFRDCTSLETISIPSSVAVIEEHAFVRCSSLREVVLNEGLEKIDWKAFKKCISLETISLPSSLVEVGAGVFENCNSLREVACSGVLPRIKYDISQQITFVGCHSLGRITFPYLSSRLEDIIRAGQVDVQNKIQQYINRGDIEWVRGGTIYIPAEMMRRRRVKEWDTAKQRFDQIVSWIKYYEMKESTTLFELALWKAEMDQVGDTDRDTHRVEVPGPVKDTILQYLDL